MNIDQYLNILYSFNPKFPGQIIFLPKGTIMLNKLKKIIKKLYQEQGSLEICTPSFGVCDIWEKTQHVNKYEDNMYKIDDKYYLKPMNCPMHIETMKTMYASKSTLPISVFEFNYCFRKEKSGSICSMLRLLRFTQDDSHILCHIKDVNKLISMFIHNTQIIYNLMGFKHIIYRLSNTNKDYIGNQYQKDLSFQLINQALTDNKITFNISEDGAFYGPKIDVMLLDKEDREWQVGTIQLDLCSLHNLDFKFQNKELIDEHLIVHQAIVGTFERFIGILLHNNIIPESINPNRLAIISLCKDKDINKTIHNKITQLDIKDVEIIKSDKISLRNSIKDIHNNGFNQYCVLGNKELETNKLILHNLKIKTNSVITLEQLLQLI